MSSNLSKVRIAAPCGVAQVWRSQRKLLLESFEDSHGKT